MNAKLISYTPSPEKVCAVAARQCYSAGVPDIKDITPGRDRDLLLKVKKSGHLSVFEHASFTFSIAGISRACSHQLVRHRVASFSQQSQRYVDQSDHIEYVTPDTILFNSTADMVFEQVMERCANAYTQLVELGIPAEDARFVLPNAVKTNIVVTMNARELMHFFSLRCCKRAQWEIRNMAIQMLRLCRTAAPLIFDEVGPGCITGGCTEGVLCCGKPYLDITNLERSVAR